MNIIVYLVADPEVDEAMYPGGLGVPIGALHMTVCAILERIDNMYNNATGIGIDTKWRTRNDGGCVQVIGAFTQQTEAKHSEGCRAELESGYVHNNYSVVTVALANLDNYWYVIDPLCIMLL